MPKTAFVHNSIPNDHKQPRLRLCDQGGGGGALVAPGGGQDTDGLVVAGQTVDAGLDQNEAELGVLVLAVALEVLADGDGLRGFSQRRDSKRGMRGKEARYGSPS